MFEIPTIERTNDNLGKVNVTKNPRIESYIIHNDYDIFEFNKEWINQLAK